MANRNLILGRSASLAACLTLLTSTVARADDPAAPRPVPVDTAPVEATNAYQLDVFLQASARQARASRRAILFTGIVTGAAMVPVGSTLWQRSDAVSQTIGAGLTIGGAAPFAFSLLSVPPSSIERLAGAYEAQRTWGNNSQAELVRATERKWEEIASASHDRRIAVGIVMAVLGGLATGSGIGLLLHSPVQGWTQNTQNTVGSVLLGAGVPVLSVGIRGLIQPTAEETWWNAYRAASSSPPSQRPTPSYYGTTVRVVPLPQGLFVGASMPP